MLARSILQIRRFWEVQRSAVDQAAQNNGAEPEATSQPPNETQNFSELLQESNRALQQWNEQINQTLPQLAQRLLRHSVWRQRARTTPSDQLRLIHLSHWNQQLRAVEDELRLEQALVRSEEQLLSLAQRSLSNLAQERTGLQTELKTFIAWLKQQLADAASSGKPPEAQTNVVPAVSRMTELEAALKKALQALPAAVQILTRSTALPKFWVKPKELNPVSTFDEAFQRKGSPAISELLHAVEAEHHRLVREIEQAREVIDFGLSADEEEQQRDVQVAQEALQNALSLLEFQRQETSAGLVEADRRFTKTLAQVFTENRAVLRRNRLGVFTYLGQQGLQQAVVLGSRNAYEATKKATRWTFDKLNQVLQQFLVQIGWKQEPDIGLSEVVTRPFLPQEFTADLNAKELPAIYRRLFRFAAVEDPRFLVGREREMEAIAEARKLWEAGRPVAVLIIGERGSGKTSLVNCAMKRPLEGLDISRGEFNVRFSDAQQLRKSLAELIGIDDPAQLEETLNAQRRVVILEELERSFLRQIGHYAAMRELQRVIAATCRTVLWVVVTNQIAFRFLDAAVSLGQSFSHRINAASASRDALRDAILLRHNLSGLRLKFALPPTKRTIFHRLRNRLSGQADAEQMFFDQLVKESVGIFRTAFEIWLGQIDVVQTGVMQMKPLIAPDLTPIIGALDLDDLFTLVAVLQHGSLNPEEHAIIFQKSVPASRAQIDELLAREIIEQDPGRPGFRVRPEALRVVKEALYRRNLL